MELRQNKRYRLSAPVSFLWESRDGAVGAGEGHTRDISVAGVFIHTSGLIPEDSIVRMEVSLPPINNEGQRIRLRTQGRVIRTEDNGFAAIANMGFRMDYQQIESGTHGGSIVRKEEDKKKSEAVLQSWVD